MNKNIQFGIASILLVGGLAMYFFDAGRSSSALVMGFGIMIGLNALFPKPPKPPH